jgi:transcription initiation factor TFIID subunit 7
MVEKKVEELLTKDNAAAKSSYGEFSSCKLYKLKPFELELVDAAEVEEATPSIAPSPSRSPSLPPDGGAEGDESMGAPTPAEGKEDEESSQDEIDDDLAAELERGIGQAGDDSSDSDDGGDGSDSDMGGLFGSGGSGEEQAPEDDDDVDENDPEQVEYRRRARLLGDEVKDLETVVTRKQQDIAGAANPIIKRRFEDTLKKLTAELELKRSQLALALAGPTREDKEGGEEGAQNEASPAA